SGPAPSRDGHHDEEVILDQTRRQRGDGTSRRSLMLKGAALGAGAIGASLLSSGSLAFAETDDSSRPTRGDLAILRFLAALEILETDLWQQYNELAGIPDSEVPGGSGSAGYTQAITILDSDMSQYIHDNTEDEISHFTFLNDYLAAKGAEPVSLKNFLNLPSSKATGAQQIPRLTNLMQLTVDTSYWTRYRSSTKNPDPPFNDTFAPAIPGLVAGQFPAIPRTDDDLKGFVPGNPPTIPDHLQAIANTAGFHFGFIEQGGSSLYPSLAQRATSPEVLRILLSIGPTETMHFQTWQDKAGNGPPLTDPTNGLIFPNLNAMPLNPDVQTNLIMPEPTVFLNRKFPPVSIIRPTETKGAAMGAVKALTDDGLFRGQPKEFFAFLKGLAEAADNARRES
ncbi:MAG: hypothetical protein ACRDIY_14400, partial [Chloroflexota bacterium]